MSNFQLLQNLPYIWEHGFQSGQTEAEKASMMKEVARAGKTITNMFQRAQQTDTGSIAQPVPAHIKPSKAKPSRLTGARPTDTSPVYHNINATACDGDCQSDRIGTEGFQHQQDHAKAYHRHFAPHGRRYDIADDRESNLNVINRLERECLVLPGFSMKLFGKEMTWTGAQVGVVVGVTALTFLLAEALMKKYSGDGESPLMKAISSGNDQAAIRTLEYVRDLAADAIEEIKANKTGKVENSKINIDLMAKQLPSNLDSALGSVFLVASFVMPFLSALLVMVTTAFQLGKTDAKVKTIHALDETNEKMKKEIEPYLREREPIIQEKIKEINGYIDALIKEGKEIEANKDDTTPLGPMIAKIKDLMFIRDRLHLFRLDELQECTKWLSNAGRMDLLNEIDEKFAKSPKTLKQAAEIFTLENAAGSVRYRVPPEYQRDPKEKLSRATMQDENWNAFDGPIAPRPKPIYVLATGSAGTGKTYAAGASSKITGIGNSHPVIGTMMQGFFDEMYPKQYDALKQNEYLAPLVSMLGNHLFAQFKARCRNAPSVINEVETRDSNGYKKYRDPGETDIDNLCIGTLWDISAQNAWDSINGHPMDGTVGVSQSRHGISGASEDRMLVTDSEEVSSWEGQWDAARDEYRANVAKFCLPPIDCDGYEYEPVLFPEDQNRLQILFKDNIDHLTNRHHEKVPGSRLDVAVKLALDTMAIRMMKSRNSGWPEPTAADMKKVIDDYYDARVDQKEKAELVVLEEKIALAKRRERVEQDSKKYGFTIKYGPNANLEASLEGEPKEYQQYMREKAVANRKKTPHQVKKDELMHKLQNVLEETGKLGDRNGDYEELETQLHNEVSRKLEEWRRDDAKKGKQTTQETTLKADSSSVLQDTGEGSRSSGVHPAKEQGDVRRRGYKHPSAEALPEEGEE